MIELFAILLPILLFDVLNPVLFALMVFAVGTRKPMANSLSLLAGHTVTYFVAGIVISFGVEQISNRLANPKSIDLVISGLVGAVCIVLALKPNKSSSEQDDPEWELTPVKCFGFGAVVNFIGLPFALPYFGAVDQIMKANLSLQDSLSILLLYNLVYALPFLFVPLAVRVMGEESKPLLARINDKIVRIADLLMPWLLFGLGVWLVADAVYYFTTGQVLIEF